MYMGDEVLLGLSIPIMPLLRGLPHVGADSGEVLELVSLLKATSRVHDVTIVEWVFLGVWVLLHVLREGDKDRALYMEVFVLAEVIGPRGDGASDAISCVVVIIREVAG